jgi:hypothetical protein
MSFTARHYNGIQRIIRETRERARDALHSDTQEFGKGYDHGARYIQEQMGRMLAADNPRFDLTRYNMECEPK